MRMTAREYATGAKVRSTASPTAQALVAQHGGKWGKRFVTAARLLPGGLTDAVDFAGRAPSELIEHIRNNT